MAATLLVALAGCEGDNRFTGAHPDAHVPVLDAGGDADSGPTPDGDATTAPPDLDASLEAAVFEASLIDTAVDTSIVDLVCPAEQRVGDGCVELGDLNEKGAGLCDGLDNNCDGRVDEGCLCQVGAVQACHVGPPNRAGIGACRPGTQICGGVEFPSWGECIGGIKPSEEQCDGLDNDCNGCTDEVEQCVNVVDCPSGGDPRVPNGQPFSTYQFDADAFVDPQYVESYRWSVRGTPCDRLFEQLPGDATSSNGQLSYTLRGANSKGPELDLTLSGEYTVTMEVALKNGNEVACTFPLKVGARGLRVELCWPESGPNSPASGEIDLDLHLGRQDLTAEWNDDDDCHERNCKTVTQQLNGGSIWGYSPSNVANCTGPGASPVANAIADECHNPRLDVDSLNVPDSRYPTENINLDAPGNGRSFRVAVRNVECGNGEACQSGPAHPLVNVYCDSELVGSYQLAKGEVDDFGAGNAGDLVDGPRDLWRVVDIATAINAGALSCTLSALSGPDEGGPWIETGTVDALAY